MMAKLELVYGGGVPTYHLIIFGNSGLDFSAGLSICLRLSYKYLIQSYIFESKHITLGMRHYKSKLGGFLRIEDAYIMLQWPGISEQNQNTTFATTGWQTTTTLGPIYTKYRKRFSKSWLMFYSACYSWAHQLITETFYTDAFDTDPLKPVSSTKLKPIEPFPFMNRIFAVPYTLSTLFVKSHFVCLPWVFYLISTDEIPRLPTVWYSICVVFNDSSHRVVVTVNGVNLIEKDNISRSVCFYQRKSDV